MSLVTQHGKTRDPRTGHSITTSHYVNTGTPPKTVYMHVRAPKVPYRPDPALDYSHAASPPPVRPEYHPGVAGMPQEAHTPHATTVEPFTPPHSPSVPCDACGAQLSPGTWPWCPH